jgi:hypothetical protein
MKEKSSGLSRNMFRRKDETLIPLACTVAMHFVKSKLKTFCRFSFLSLNHCKYFVCFVYLLPQYLSQNHVNIHVFSLTILIAFSPFFPALSREAQTVKILMPFVKIKSGFGFLIVLETFHFVSIFQITKTRARKSNSKKHW